MSDGEKFRILYRYCATFFRTMIQEQGSSSGKCITDDKNTVVVFDDDIVVRV